MRIFLDVGTSSMSDFVVAACGRYMRAAAIVEA
jgi:hypothetical protein